MKLGSVSQSDAALAATSRHTTMQIPSKGWMPQHLVLRDASQANAVVACCPLYLKGHSYGCANGLGSQALY